MKGKSNVVADALSRKLAISLMEISADWKDQLAAVYSKNKFSCELLDGLIQYDMHNILNGFIYYKDILYLVPVAAATFSQN